MATVEVPVEIKDITINAVITRASGEVEDCGTIARMEDGTAVSIQPTPELLEFLGVLHGRRPD